MVLNYLFRWIVNVLPIPKVFSYRTWNQMVFGYKRKKSTSSKGVSWITSKHSYIFHAFSHFYVFGTFIRVSKWYWNVIMLYFALYSEYIDKYVLIPVSSFVLHMTPLLSVNARLTNRLRASRLSTYPESSLNVINPIPI